MGRSFGLCPKCGEETFDDIPCCNGCECEVSDTPRTCKAKVLRDDYHAYAMGSLKHRSSSTLTPPPDGWDFAAILERELASVTTERDALSETDKLTSIAAELERHENFWRDKTDDSYGINLSVCMSINAIRQAVLSAMVEHAESKGDNASANRRGEGGAR